MHDVGSDIVFSVWPLYLTTVLGANMHVLGFVDGLGDAMVSISQAVLGYISDNSNRGTNFGILHAMDNFGAIFGVLISLLFISTFGYRNLFLFAAIPSVFATLMIIVYIKEPKSAETKIFKGFSFKSFNFNIKLYTFASALFSLGTFSYSFLLISAKNDGFTIGQVPIFYLLFTIVAGASSIPAGKLSDKFGRKKVLYFSMFLWMLVMALLIAFNSFLGVALAFICYGLHKGALDTSQRTLIADLAPKELLSSTLGGFQMIIGLCSLPASFIAGLLWDMFGMSAPFYLSIGLTLLAIITLKFVKEKA